MTASVGFGCGVPLDAAPDPERLTDRRRHRVIHVDIHAAVQKLRAADTQAQVDRYRKEKL